MTVEQFGKALVASGLMTADDVKAVWTTIPGDARPKSDADFGKLLVDKSLLTPFQVAEIIAGRGARLVMGDYTIAAQIGAGGMGQVYKANHRRMKRTVALKVMSNAAMQDEAAVKRFQREVHAAAKLEHPNIVTAYDSGESGNVKYLVMQFVDGGDLSDLVKKGGRLPIEQAVGYVIQAARGLAFAHGEGVIHRDIKPANLLLDKKGVVKILDMGLARFEDGGDGLTATEQVMGTVDYMSPEQAANTKGCDGRADIYSLGCTLWFLLTGKKLYEADTLIARLMLHRDGPLPSLVKERDDAPWPLEQALHKMIAKRVQDRFQSMDEAIAALAPFGGSAAGGSSSGSSPSVSQNADLASFMQAMGTGGGTKTNISATQVRPSTSANVDATAQFTSPEVGTDPKSQVLPKSAKTAKPQSAKKATKPGNNKTKLIAAGGALLGLLLLAGIIVKIRDKDGNVVAEVNAPTGASVEVVTQPQPAVKPIVSGVTPPPATLTLAQLFESPDYVWTAPENLGPTINGPGDEDNCSLTKDELRLFFHRKRAGDGANDFVEAVRATPNERFGTPRAHFSGTEVFASADGLSLVSTAGGESGNHNIQLRRRSSLDAAFEPNIDLGPLVNSPSSDRRPTLSPDGLSLVFATEREAGKLGDLWISRRKTTNELFGPAENAGSAVNSDGWEHAGLMLADNRTLLFFRHQAGWHLRFTNSTSRSGSIKIPNLPFGGALDLWLSPDCRTAYFADARPGGFGGKDIYVTRLVPKSGATPAPSFVASVTPSFISPTAPQTPPPAGDYALKFTRDSKVEAPNPELDESQPFTAEAYITPGEVDPNNSLIGVRLFGVDGEFHLETKDSRWRFYSTHNEAMSPERFTPRRRVHVAGVRTTTGRLLFLDGKLVASSDEPLRLPSKQSKSPLLLEARRDPDFTFDELRITQGIVYDKEFAPPAKLIADANTLALYHFDEGFGNVLKDSSGKGRDGKITGATWVKADGSPIPAVPASAVPASAGPASSGIVYLDDLPETEWKDGAMKLGKHNLNFNGRPYTWRGKQPTHALMTHTLKDQTAYVSYQIAGRYETFSVTTGIDDDAGGGAASPQLFRILGDGRELWKSPPLQKVTDEAKASISVRGVQELRLEVTCGKDNFRAHAVWFEPRLTPSISVPQIPTEALAFGGHRYLLVDCGPPGTPFVWDQARAQAEAVGGHLAAINSQAEYDWVRDNIWLKRPKTTGHHGRLFLGASTAADSIEWKWVTGEPLELSLWTTGIPDPNPRDRVLVWVKDDKPDRWVGGSRADFQGGYYLVEWDTLGAPFSQTGPQTADYALQFDGKSAHVATPLVHQPNEPLTIEVTLQPGPFRGAIVSDSEGRGIGLDVVDDVPNFLVYRRSGGKESYARISATRKLENDRPHRLAGVFDGAKLRLFIDGKLQATADLAGEYLPSGLPFIIGASPEDVGVDYPFAGTLDEVRFSKSARYTANYTPPSRLEADADTLALYHFDEGLGDVLKDSSGKGRDGKITGATWVKADGSPIPATPASIPASPAPQIPAEALTFGGHRYLLVESFCTWSEAKAKAEAMGGHLAAVNSKEERDWILTNVFQKRPRGGKSEREVQMRLGGMIAGPGSRWTWITGEPFDESLWLGPLPAVVEKCGLSWRADDKWLHVPTDNRNTRSIYFLVEWDTLGPQIASAAPTPAGPTSPLTGAPPAATATAAVRWPLAETKPEEIAWLKSLNARIILRNGTAGDFAVPFNGAVPSGSWTVVGVELNRERSQEIDDKVLERIGKLVDLEIFMCDFPREGTRCTKAGLDQLKQLKNLRQLGLGRIVGPNADPKFLDAFPDLESLTLRNEQFIGWEPHAARMNKLENLSLYMMNDSNLELLGIRPRLVNLRFAGYQDHHPLRLAATKPFIAANPWCRVTYVGLDGDNMKQLVIEPTAPPPSVTSTPGDDQATVAKWLLDNKKLAKIGFEVGGRAQYMSAVPTGPYKVIELSFSKNNNAGQPLTEVEVARLAVFTDLESLEISSLTDAGLAKLAPLKKLKSLILNGSPLTPAAVATIRQFAQLEKLHAFSSDEWLKPLAGMPSIKYLIFYRSDISVEAMSWFAQYPNLNDLDLVDCLTADRLNAALAPLKDCKSLSKLTLSTSGGDAGTVVVLSGLHQLRELDLTRTPFAEAQVKQLAAALPRCKVTWGDAANKQHIFEPTAPPATAAGALPETAIEQWIKETSTKPAAEQLAAVSKKLIELNPGFDGKLYGPRGTQPPTIENGVVMSLKLNGPTLTDLSPLRALTGLTELTFGGPGAPKGKFTDLSSLRGLQLQTLVLSGMGQEITDLSPLAGMPLEFLGCREVAKLTDLGPIAGMSKLKKLDVLLTSVADLSPLAGLQTLEVLVLPKSTSDLSPLKNLKLTHLECGDISSLEPLRGMPLETLWFWGANLTDFAPLYELKTLAELRILNSENPTELQASLSKALPNCRIDYK